MFEVTQSGAFLQKNKMRLSPEMELLQQTTWFVGRAASVAEYHQWSHLR